MLSRTISGFIVLFPVISVYLGLSWLFQANSGYLGKSPVIFGYLSLSKPILGCPWLSQADLGFFRLPGTISGYQVSSTRVSVEAGKNKLLLFVTNYFLFYITRSNEEIGTP